MASKKTQTAAPVSLSILLGLLAGCSDGDSKSFEDQLAEYNSIASERISSFAETIAPAHTAFLLSADAAQSGRAFEEQKTKALESLRDDVCAELAKVAEVAGSGAERTSRLDRVKKDSDVLLQNQVAFQILRSALEHPPQERDLLLEQLTIKKADGGVELQGMDALKALGLLSPEGRFLEPSPGTATYAGGGTRRCLSAAALGALLFEDLHPGRNTTFIVARGVALVVVVVALPIDQEQAPGVRPGGSP